MRCRGSTASSTIFHRSHRRQSSGSRSTMAANTLITAHNRFAFKLFAEVAKQPRENVFISPLSVALVLSMVYNGARGETQRAMAEALDLSGVNLDEINQSSAALLQSLGQIDPAIQLAIA